MPALLTALTLVRSARDLLALTPLTDLDALLLAIDVLAYDVRARLQPSAPPTACAARCASTTNQE